MDEVRVLSPTGMLGSGFAEASLARGVELAPHVIAVDGGSTDMGPAYLGAGQPGFSRESTKRDVRLLLLARDRLAVPLIIGSCGTGGGDAGVDWIRDICLEIARDDALHFRLSLIRSEQEPADLQRWLRDGRISPLRPAPELTEEVIERSAHIVGMMGPEPIAVELERGADVILCGRASDTSLFAALPLRMGAPAGPTWHAAKILECGAACAAIRRRPDGVFGWIRDDHFEVEPLALDMICTPQSVASHTLYENADPFRIIEPGGVIETADARYEATSERAVAVRGSTFRESETYTIKLEGAEVVGYQTVIIGGVRDPYIIRQLDPWLDGMRAGFGERVEEIFGGRLTADDYTIDVRVYGRDAVMGRLEPERESLPHEVGLLFEVTAADQETATSLAKVFAHFAVHFPIPEWNGLITGIAYPFAPAEIERGIAYRFNMNHVVEPQDPLELFRAEQLEL